MAQPRDYTRQYNFKDFQATSPSSPLPGTEVDAELNSVKLTLVKFTPGQTLQSC